MATQFLTLEQSTIERFDQVQAKLARIESVDQSELTRLMADLPDLHQLQTDLAAINARSIRLRDEVNDVKSDQKNHELKVSDKINEVGARIGTQLNIQRNAIDEASRLAREAVAHNKGFVSSDEFDQVLSSIERQLKRNITTLDMKLDHRAAVDNRLDSRLTGIETRVMDAAEASENAQEVAESLLSTIQESFGQVISQKEELHNTLTRKVQDIRNRLGTVENFFAANITRLQARFGDYL